MSIVSKAYELREKIEMMAKGLDDAEALECTAFFPKWTGEGVSYVVGDRVRYNDDLYSVLQNHVSQADWNPVDAVSLFAKVLIPDSGEVPDWEQQYSTNPYMEGDHVVFNGVEYVSLINNNVWSPADYPAGWQAV